MSAVDWIQAGKKSNKCEPVKGGSCYQAPAGGCHAGQEPGCCWPTHFSKEAGNPGFLLMYKYWQQRPTCSAGWLSAGHSISTAGDSFLGDCRTSLNMSSILTPLGCQREATVHVQGVTPRTMHGLCSLYRFLPTHGNSLTTDL